MLNISDYLNTNESPPLIIAEMSGNHNQSLDRAMAIVEAAANSGVHALKLQTYTADTITLDLDEGDFFISEPNSLWKGASLYQLYKDAYTPWEWHEPLLKYARELGMIAFSTPFDETAVDFLESLNVPCYKIASFENTHIPLIRKVASTGKPMIISTGMATMEELDESVTAAREAGCNELVLLKCTSTYPATASNSNLHTIPDLKSRYGCSVGLSDHTMGVEVAIASVALGARVIEKHFTLSRSDGGVDSAFSMEPNEMARLVKETKQAWLSLGKVHYGPTEDERVNSLKYRRSLYFSRDLKKGEELTLDNVKAIRPGGGLATKYLDQVIGMKTNSDVSKGTPLSWGLIIED